MHNGLQAAKIRMTSLLVCKMQKAFIALCMLLVTVNGEYSVAMNEDVNFRVNWMTTGAEGTDYITFTVRNLTDLLAP